MTANTWFKVKGSKVKVTAYVTANTDSLQIRLVSRAFLSVNLELHKPIRDAEGVEAVPKARSRGAVGAEGGEVWGGGVPLPRKFLRYFV